MAAPARIDLVDAKARAEHLLTGLPDGYTPRYVGDWFAEARAQARVVLSLVEAVEAAQAYIAKYDSAGSGRQSWAVSRSQRETLRAALASFGEPAA